MIIPALIPVRVVIRALAWIRDLVLIRVRAPEVRLGAWSALEVRIATHGREVRGPRGKVVRGQVGRKMIVVIA